MIVFIKLVGTAISVNWDLGDTLRSCAVSWAAV